MLADTTQTEIFTPRPFVRTDPTRPNFAVVGADATHSLRLGEFPKRCPARVLEAAIAKGCAMAAFGLSRAGMNAFMIGSKAIAGSRTKLVLVRSGGGICCA